ncbi:MAG: amidohydrolase family protein [bacterium]
MKNLAIFALVLTVDLMGGCSHLTETTNDPETLPENFPAEDVTGVITFVNVNVVPMTEERIIPGQSVIVRDGKIEKIGAVDQIAIPDGSHRVDGAGKYLMPGLADMHTHIYYQEDLLPYLANGVTTVLNMGSPAAILQFREQVRRGEILGPAIFASAFVDGAGNRGWIVRTPEEARTDVRDIKNQGWDFIKVYNSIDAEVFKALMEEAKQQGLAVIGHGVRAPGMQGILQAGQVMIAHAEEYIYTHFQNRFDASQIPAAIAMTKSAGAYVTTTLSAYETIMLQWGNPAGLETLLARPEMKYVRPSWLNEWRSSNRYTRNSGSLAAAYEFQKRFVKDFQDAGIPLLLGTDTPTIPGIVPGFGIHQDLRNLASSGLTPYEAIAAGTRNAGEFINRFVASSEPFGTIEVGKRADLILVQENPLANIEHVSKRIGVMVRGRWLSETKLRQMLEALAESFGN